MKQAFCLLRRIDSSTHGYHTEACLGLALMDVLLQNMRKWIRHRDRVQIWQVFVARWMACLFFELWFWWKTPESEDSLISHTPNEGVCTTSCHYWKRKRQKVWATSKNEGWFTFSHACPLSSSPILSYKGFPSPCNRQIVSLTLFEFVLFRVRRMI